MKKVLFYLLWTIVFATAKSQVLYNTISPGNWSSASTWANGSIPQSSIAANAIVYINHNVTYNLGSDLEVRGRLEIYNNTLRFQNNGSGRSLFLRSTGYLKVSSGGLIMPVRTASGSNNSGNFINEGGHFVALNSDIEIAQNLSGFSGSRRFLEGSCILLGENYENVNATDTLRSVCIEMGLHGSSNFTNDGGTIRMNTVSIQMRGGSGNFENKSSSSRILTYLSPSYAVTALQVNGNLTNSGIWEAPINRYCIGGGIADVSNTNNQIDRPATEDCAFFTSYTCDCAAAEIPPLPVDFKSFSATRNNQMVILQWETATETNNSGFYVERNTKGTWEELAFIPSATVDGNSSIGQVYVYHDINKHTGLSQYRLRQVDFDGSKRYSSIQAVRAEQQATQTIIYPNPSPDGSVNIVFEANKRKNVTVFDMNGRAIQKHRNVFNNLHIVRLNAGVYSIEVEDISTSHKIIERVVVRH